MIFPHSHGSTDGDLTAVFCDIYLDLERIAAWSISLSLCEAVLTRAEILLDAPVIKLSRDPVKLPPKASPLRVVEGENMGPASMGGLRSALCTDDKLPDDTDRWRASLSFIEDWHTKQQR